MPRRRRQPERRLSPRHEFLSLFFGQVVATDVREIVDPGPSIEVVGNFGLPSRERSVAFTPHHEAAFSAHVVDLSPPPAEPSSSHRPFGPSERFAILANRIGRFFRRPGADELSRMNPHLRSKAGGSVAEFLSLPLLFMRSLVPARKPRVRAPRPKPAKAKVRVAEKEIVAPEPRGPLFSRPAEWKGSLVTFGAVGVMVLLPVLLLTAFSGALDDIDFAERQTTIALDDLKAAGKDAIALNSEAAVGFTEAARRFADTRSRLTSATLQLGALVTGNGGKLKAGESLLAAGEDLSKAGAVMTAAFEGLDDASDMMTTDRISRLLKAFSDALPHIDSGIATLERVPARSVPEAYRATFTATLDELRSLRDHAAAVAASSDTVLEMLGGGGKRRYLVLFQNDRELRPTGGFIGSYALMDIEDGRVTKTEIPAGGSYDLRGGLTERIAAPEQLRLVNPRWEFQDANWFADFPSSARALTWFYEKSGGPTIDGVIAVTSTFMEDLLGVIGPVDIRSHGKTITAENFYIETQKAVEVDYDRELNRPKQFISDMAPLVLERLVNLEGEGLLPLVSTVSRAVDGKRLMVYFRDEDEQALASDFGWAGEMKGLPDADFLAVVDTNIAGGKTDGVVSADINHEMRVAPDGSLVDTLTIRRTHHGEEGDLFTGIKNIDYMRVYVPHGSVLLSAEGFERPGDGYFIEPDGTLEPSTMLSAVEGRRLTDDETGTVITEESGFTVFGNWIQLEPGESRAVRLSYRLPFTLDGLVKGPESLVDRAKSLIGAYAPTAGMKLVVHRQPGAANRTFSSVIRLPDGWAVRSRVPEQATYREGMLSYEGALDHDLYIGSVLTKID